MERVPMTQAGYKKRLTQVEKMEQEEMPEILVRLAEARAEGDLRENAEYHGARESQGMLQAKINMLRDELARSVIVDVSKMPKDEVAFGATVTVRDLSDDEEEEYTLVGAGEEDYDLGRIQVTSPVAQGLLHKKIGEVVDIEVPRGTMQLEILAIKYDL